MPNEPLWLPLEQIIEVNKDEIASSPIPGEEHHILDLKKLESAAARPCHYYWYGEDDMLRLAMLLMVGIAQAHSFEQGNKRTAWTCGVMFMQMNGYTLDWDHELVAEEFVKLINGEITIDRFEQQIVYNVVCI